MKNKWGSGAQASLLHLWRKKSKYWNSGDSKSSRGCTEEQSGKCCATRIQKWREEGVHGVLCHNETVVYGVCVRSTSVGSSVEALLEVWSQVFMRCEVNRDPHRSNPSPAIGRGILFKPQRKIHVYVVLWLEKCTWNWPIPSFGWQKLSWRIWCQIFYSMVGYYILCAKMWTRH